MAVDGVIAGLSGMSHAVAGFQAATAAGFTISQSGGQALLNAIDDMIQAAEETLMRAEMLAQEPPLGTTPAAQVYKPFLASIATDPAQGFIPAIDKFKEDLARLRTNVEQAMGSYRSTDDDRAQGLQNIGGSTLSA
ncbi:hypothetical protein FHS29_006964 [Saccharothrix tamanrassetensis]|uniref:PE family protein n=1 Tax=Saccharothrix tamanrassetensis TaxID=1051531 RepID=A0A841CRH9_9PSEU|nr:hypothetical protein [Saccharothrix tamanrassetensis]MBB5960341.1 hypothetical protein [Saccharothrix tamanrassetensis]